MEGTMALLRLPKRVGQEDFQPACAGSAAGTVSWEDQAEGSPGRRWLRAGVRSS